MKKKKAWVIYLLLFLDFPPAWLVSDLVSPYCVPDTDRNEKDIASKS